jgi:hypothetical protein
MKRNLLFALMSALALVSALTVNLTGCKEEPEPVVDSLTCKIGSVLFKADKSLTGTVDQGILIINGVNLAGDTLRMLLQDQQPGTYPIKNIQNIMVYKKNGTTYLPLNSADAALTILSNDVSVKLITGTFYYTADDGAGNSLLITNGNFRCTYQ